MKKAKRILCLALTLALLLSLAGVAGAVGEPRVTAAAAVVLDYDTGEYLYEKDADTMRVPASMTKIMTAYILYQELEAGNITKDTAFTISDNARRMSYDSSYPTAVPLVGETVTVDQLLGLIMVPSASASCVVAAENISGSEAAFVERMNATAKALGMEAAYENCHGARPHYITARSVAILIREFIEKYPDILHYTSLTAIEYAGSSYANTNRLLSDYYYEGADGFKTGTIAESGYCLSATAERDGRRLITVVMASSSTAARHTDSIALLDYGFQELARRDAARENAQVEIWSADPLRVGGDVPVRLRFDGVTAPFSGDFCLYLNEALAAQFKTTVSQGTVLETDICLDADFAGQESLEAALVYDLADGSQRRFTAELEISPLPAPAFRDITWHWAETEIQGLYDAGAISGYPDGTFRPEDQITRAEFAALAARVGETRLDAAGETGLFPDMTGHWAETEVCRLAAAGFVQGDTQGNFRPEDSISRQEAAALTAALAGLEGEAESLSFTDGEEIAPWAEAAVAAAAEAGLLSGYPDGSFRPQAALSRAESAALLSALAAYL